MIKQHPGNLIVNMYFCSYDERFESELKSFVGPTCVEDCITSLVNDAKTLLKSLR